MGKRSLIWGTLTMAAALVAAMSGRAIFTHTWIAAGVVAAVTACFGFYCRRRIAGITGDTLGANVQLCESAALLTFLWVGYPQ
jgi:cobalamin synthase